MIVALSGPAQRWATEHPVRVETPAAVKPQRPPTPVYEAPIHAALLDSPVGMPEATAMLTVKKVLPVNLSSNDIAGMDADVRERSFVAAGVDQAKELEFWKDGITEISEGRNNVAQMRVAFNNLFEKSELNKQWRQDLLVRTNLDATRGFGQTVRGLTEDSYFAAPAWELIRFEPRLHPRGDPSYKPGTDGAVSWEERWQAALDEGGSPEEQAVFDATGRMIALKDSGVWQALGDGAGGVSDNLGMDYPPYAFNSGMDRIEVERQECIDLGLPIPDEGEGPDAEAGAFNEGAEIPAGVEDSGLVADLVDILTSGNLKGTIEFNKKTGKFVFP